MSSQISTNVIPQRTDIIRAKIVSLRQALRSQDILHAARQFPECAEAVDGYSATLNVTVKFDSEEFS